LMLGKMSAGVLMLTTGLSARMSNARMMKV
jgi:hypothetical protein